MKVRMDYVTNSSSSSFVLAKKGQGELSDIGRDKLATLLINRFLRNFELFDNLTPENINTHEDFVYKSEKQIAKAKTAMEEGFQIVRGYASWDEAEYQLGNILEETLKILEEEQNYRIIDDDLSW